MRLFVVLGNLLISDLIPMIPKALLKTTNHETCIAILKYDVLFQRYSLPKVSIQNITGIFMVIVFESKVDRALTSKRR